MATRQSITCTGICYNNTINLIYAIQIHVYLMTCCFLFRRCNIDNNCDISCRCCDIYRQRIFCDISRQQCDIYRQWGLRRFQQIATFPGDGATFSVDYDVSLRCDISRRYNCTSSIRNQGFLTWFCLGKTFLQWLWCKYLVYNIKNNFKQSI